jgi:hypothetical protein
MSIKKLLLGSLMFAVAGSATCFATAASPDAMRGADAIAHNTKLASSISLTKDASSNIISFHVNGVNPSDAEILLMRTPSLLSTEFTLINGTTKEGTSTSYMLPTNVATSLIIEQISKDLVNAGAISIAITKQKTGEA